MPTYRQYNYDINELQKFANQVKEVLIGQLANEGIINVPKDVLENYAIVLAEKNWLGRSISKAMGHTDENAVINVVKVIGKDKKDIFKGL